MMRQVYETWGLAKQLGFGVFGVNWGFGSRFGGLWAGRDVSLSR